MEEKKKATKHVIVQCFGIAGSWAHAITQIAVKQLYTS